MDHGLCNVLYLDRKARKSGYIRRNELSARESDRQAQEEVRDSAEDDSALSNLRAILETFSEVYVCVDGTSCLQKISQIDESQVQGPTLVLITIPVDDERRPSRQGLDVRTPSPTNSRRPQVEKDEPSDVYGMDLLSHLATSIHQHTLSRLIIPVAVIESQPATPSSTQQSTSSPSLARTMSAPDTLKMVRYLEAGAADVLASPLGSERVQGLAVHAYKIFKDVTKEDAGSILTKRGRKLSWIGIEEERPFAYLRESMVSGLMEGICNPESIGDGILATDLHVDPSRQRVIATAVGQWSFSAHDFTSDELVYAAMMILQHALKMNDLQQWRIPTEDLTVFLLACRRAYNDFVLYHNFRHVVDVLQAIFYFLLQIGALPPYAADQPQRQLSGGALNSLLKPFDALTLLVAAIGHDVGHPGVNNAFLVALNAPLAQLYNDRSVLEAFHCAAYSQILRRFWPAAFDEIPMRRLMINSILATDMGLHFKFVMDMGNLQEKLAANKSTTDGWSPKVMEETRDTVCGLLIKCADISNVARKYGVAAQWARILTDEFSNQGAMEKELNLPTCLFGGPPDPSDAIKMAESQLGFMNIFARPLFEGVSDILPEMGFSLTELGTNKAIWQEKIDAEQKRRQSHRHSSYERATPSPMTRSTATIKETDGTSHAEPPAAPVFAERDSLFGPSRHSLSAPDHHRSSIAPSSGASSMIAQQNDGPLAVSGESNRLGSLSRNNPDRGSRSGASTSSVQFSDGPHTVLGEGHRLGSLSRPTADRPDRGSRTSMTMPFFGPSGNTSRRSSKDAALDQYEQMKLSQRNSHVESPSFEGSRSGSADASLTTILIRSPRSQSGKETSLSNPTTPVKPVHSGPPTISTNGTDLSHRSQTASNATANTSIPVSPSTKASSLEPVYPSSDGLPEPRSIPSTESPYRDPHLSPDISLPQKHASSAPDVLALAAGSPAKSTTVSQLSSDDVSRSYRNEKPDMRQSRSHSRLRGLRFWKKRYRSPELGLDRSP